MIEPDSASNSDSRCLIIFSLHLIYTHNNEHFDIITHCHVDLVIRNHHSMLVATSFHLDSGQLLCFY
jgi:hypothetical protein